MLKARTPVTANGDQSVKLQNLLAIAGQNADGIGTLEDGPFVPFRTKHTFIKLPDNPTLHICVNELKYLFYTNIQSSFIDTAH